MALTRAAYARWVPLLGREPLPMAVDYAAAVTRDRIDLLCDIGGAVALIHLVERPDDVLIESLAVDPAAQRRGLGVRLLAHAAAVARGRATPTLRLYTNALFAENLGFYGRHGFLVERQEPFRGGHVVHMRRVLEPA